MSWKPTAEIVENADHAGQKTRGGTSATPSPTTTTPGVTNTYDANSHLASFDGPWADDTITYALDALGRRTNLLVQGSQPTGYDYDALNRLTGVRVGPQTYAYTYASASPLVQRLAGPTAASPPTNTTVSTA